MTATLLVRVPPEIARWVRSEAKKQDRPVAWVLRKILAAAKAAA